MTEVHPARADVSAADRDTAHRHLADLFAGIAVGRFPPADGAVEVLPHPGGPVAGVLSFTAHHVVVADVDPTWVHDRLPPGDLAAPLGARFLATLGDVLGSDHDSVDIVLVAAARPAPPHLELVPVDAAGDHPRLARAARYRSGVRAWTTADGAGLVLIGQGLGGRWETAFEVAPEARGRGLGAVLATAARHLVPDHRPVFAQVAPGNLPSLRSLLTAGYAPVGGELLYPVGPAGEGATGLLASRSTRAGDR